MKFPTHKLVALIAAVAPPVLLLGAVTYLLGPMTIASAQMPVQVLQSVPNTQALSRRDPGILPATDVDYSHAELRCLASAMYHEAGREPREGQIAIAEVVIARSRDRRWRGNLCKTITMKRQFSFVRQGLAPPIDDPAIARRMERLAQDVVAGRAKSRARGSLYFHAAYVQPVWRHSLDKTVRISTHIFYTDAGLSA